MRTNIESGVEQRVEDISKGNTRPNGERLGLFVDLERLPLTQVQR